MLTKSAKSSGLLRALGLLGLIAVSGVNLWGEGKCMAFQANLQGALVLSPLRGWSAQGYITAGDTVLQARVFWPVSTVVPEKFNPKVFMGTEKAVVTVEGVGTFELVSRFVSPHRLFKEGVAILNEAGTIGNGTGSFAGVSGHFTDHGVYGPGVPGGVPPVNYGFLTSMNGNICGIDLSGLGLTPAAH